MSRLIVVWAVLTAVWVVLTGTLAPGFLITGVVVSAVAVLLCRELILGDSWLGHREDLRPLEATDRGLLPMVRRLGWRAAFVPGFLWKVLQSGLYMALLALRPSVDFWPGIVRVRGGLRTTTGTTLFANLLTLTPGTMTIDYDQEEDVLYLHWIDVTGYGEEDFDTRVTSGLRRWMERMGV